MVQSIELKTDQGTNLSVGVRHYQKDQIESRIGKIQERANNCSKQEKRRLLLKSISMIDLTTLEGSDNQERVQKLCQTAKNTGHADANQTAAVCVYPVFIQMAKQYLSQSPVQVACVATGFPAGQIPLRLKLEEVNYCLEQGVDEIDMVISRGEFLARNYQQVFTEIESVAKACKNKAKLKVILETGELQDLNLIRLASDISILAGADFIKTSTGKISPAATLPASMVMLEAIKDHYDSQQIQIGFKPAGGIRSGADVLTYFSMVEEILSDQWLTPNLFRIGASSLLGNLIEELKELN